MWRSTYHRKWNDMYYPYRILLPSNILKLIPLYMKQPWVHYPNLCVIVICYRTFFKGWHQWQPTLINNVIIMLFIDTLFIKEGYHNVIIMLLLFIHLCRSYSTISYALYIHFHYFYAKISCRWWWILCIAFPFLCPYVRIIILLFLHSSKCLYVITHTLYYISFI